MLGRTGIALTQHELSEDRSDIIASYLVRLAHDVSASTQVFGGVYLFSHGVIKVFLVESLLRGRLWAYPTAIVFIDIYDPSAESHRRLGSLKESLGLRAKIVWHSEGWNP